MNEIKKREMQNRGTEHQNKKTRDEESKKWNVLLKS